MNLFDAPRFRQREPLRTYPWQAAGPLMAAPIIRDGATEAFVFHGVGDEIDRAGVVERRYDDADRLGDYWRNRLDTSFAAGVPAQQAVSALLGEQGPPEAGRMGEDLRRYEGGWRELDELLHPALYERRRAAKAAQAAQPTRANIDAALAGQLPISPAIAEHVANLDSALALRPVREPIIVKLTMARHELPDVVQDGVRIYRATFTESYLTGIDHEFLGADVVVNLRVDAGVPALFQEPRLPGGPGLLLLARGLEWEVDRVVQMPGQLAVFGHTIGVRPGEVTVAPTG